ncbi:hypothetical protein VTL71DRAFT_11000 [Oculimacula yallundae]|uniref:Uncharacterized protein n=1 Tax=Oculimacula yallundae TaxID=86028 RepID=A0ABR4CUT2_9HELO
MFLVRVEANVQRSEFLHVPSVLRTCTCQFNPPTSPYLLDLGTIAFHVSADYPKQAQGTYPCDTRRLLRVGNVIALYGGDVNSLEKRETRNVPAGYTRAPYLAAQPLIVSVPVSLTRFYGGPELTIPIFITSIKRVNSTTNKPSISVPRPRTRPDESLKRLEMHDHPSVHLL